MSITAIVVSYNSAAVIRLCIDALYEHLRPGQVVVVDNASTDASAAIARDLGATVVVSQENVGFGAACNLGAQEADHDILLFVNPDVCIAGVDMTRLREVVAREPLGLVAPRTLLARDERHSESSVRRILPWPCNIVREAFGPVLPRALSDQLFAVVDTPGKRSWLSGALLIAARTEFLELGGFDERFFLYYEDQELSRRYLKHGLPLWTTDAIAGRHVRGGSSDAVDNMRPIPRAASAISSVELVGVTHGSLTARLAWVLYQSVRRCAVAVAWLTARSPLSSRGARKQDELQRTHYAVATLLRDGSPRYPLVKKLTRATVQRHGARIRCQ